MRGSARANSVQARAAVPGVRLRLDANGGEERAHVGEVGRPGELHLHRGETLGRLRAHRLGGRGFGEAGPLEVSGVARDLGPMGAGGERRAQAGEGVARGGGHGA